MKIIKYAVFIGLMLASTAFIQVPGEVLPSKAQLKWADSEIGVLIHFDLPVFEPGYDFRKNWNYHPDLSIFNPTELNTDQWIAAAKSAGATYAVLVAKHCSGFSLWPTRAHPYSVKNTPWRNGQGDIVRDFVASCKKYGLKPGIYASTTANGYLKVDNPGKVVSGDPEEQKRYNDIVKMQLTELWSEYGKLMEVWFDGGVLPPEKGGFDVLAMLKKYQPQAIAFQGPYGHENNIRWVGNEEGVAPYPCWSRADSTTSASGVVEIKGLNGNPNGLFWCPGESDFPLRLNSSFQGGWFWHKDQDNQLRTLDELRNKYCKSVGRNTNMLLGLVIDNRGLVPDADVQRLKEFGQMIDKSFSVSLGKSAGSGNELTVNFKSPKPIAYVTIMEDIKKGERIREYKLQGMNDGKWEELATGSSIGHKRIEIIKKGVYSAVRLEVIKSEGPPAIRNLECFGRNSEPLPAITFQSLLQEMGDHPSVTYWPIQEYKSLQASSYNRASVAPDQPGWFADSDGVNWIREEINGGKKEYVIMEHDGPGCITRMWTPFFYYNFNNRTGPNVKIYLDGNKTPVINENFISLLTGKGTILPPFATYTARAGVSFLPIPFSKGCKITLDDKAFYNIINYRAFNRSAKVETFSKATYLKASSLLATTTEKFENPQQSEAVWQKSFEKNINPNDSLIIHLPRGNHAIELMNILIDTSNGLQSLRSTILKITFDGKQTVWAPVGDFFCSPDTINPFKTRNLSVTKDGKMNCRWMMPYASDAQLTLINLQGHQVSVSVDLKVGNYNWNDRSMYFHANWANPGPLPGNHFFDINFINITGKGVLAGDALTVLSPGKGWWGEGDEKIYIDENDINRKFPSHFGTGTEDYYGWAGGVVPTGEDLFSRPFGSNVRIGNRSNPSGYNICMRNRILDGIPFNNRLIFDMEASPGTDIRNHWNLLSYSTITYWYGMPGATSNRIPQHDLAKQRLISVPEIERMEKMVKDRIINFNTEELKKRVRDTAK